MKYVNSLKYMNSFEPSGSLSDISLSGAAALCELLGRVNINTKSIFLPSGMAGYTTSVMLESVIKSEGYRVGRITLEFGFDCRKMVYIDGAQANIEDFNRAVAELKAKVNGVPDRKFSREEASFALSLLLCRMNDCKYIILEGMSCEDFELASLCAPYDIVIVPEIRDVNDKALSVVCRAISRGTRAIVSANQKLPVYNKLSSVSKTGINLTAKQSLTVKNISSIRLDFSYGNRDGYTIKTPSLIGRECAMLVIDAAQAMRRDGVKVQWANIEAGLASAMNLGACDTFSVSPVMLFDSASDEYGVSLLKSTLDEVFGNSSLENLSICAPVAALPILSSFEGVASLILVGEQDSNESNAMAQEALCCKDLKAAAKQLKANIKNGKNTVKLPKMLKGKGGYNFSYSGLKTAVINHVHKLKQKGEEVNIGDVACSFQCSAIDVLVDKAIKAVKEKGYDTLTIGGGVAANGYLREALKKAVEGSDISLVIPEKRYCTDNGAMIAAEGYLQYKKGNFADIDLNAKAVVPLK